MGESSTDNNCSDGVSVTVSSSSGGGGSGGSLGVCRAGLVVNPNESCTYKGFTFSVSSSGSGVYRVFQCWHWPKSHGDYKWRAMEFCCLKK